MKNIPLHWKVIIGLVLGVAWAAMAVYQPVIDLGFMIVRPGELTMDYIKPLGDIFINLLKLIAVPLVLFSIIAGIISLQDVRKLGRMGLKTLGIYLATTVFAVTLGLVVVNVWSPGTKQADHLRIENRISYELWLADNPDVQKLDDMCLSCDPANADLVASVRSRMQNEGPSDWVADKLNKRASQKESGPLQPVVDMVPSNLFRALTDMEMLQIIFFAILFGVALVSLPKEKVSGVYSLIDGLNEVFVKLVWIVMSAMPVFVFALMAGQVVKAAGTDPDKFLELLAFYVQYGSAVLLGLAIMAFLVYPTLIQLFTQRGFMQFLSGIKNAQLTAFSTSSSVATLPVTMESIEKNIGVSKSTTSFVLPIGATVNMDGTSLYQAVAVVAMAQFHMVDLTIGQQLMIVLTASLASIGAAAIPSAGLVLMIMVLESVGLPAVWIAIIFPVDRILDMCRTVVNVTGDATVATIVASTEGQLNDPQPDSD